MLIATNVNGFDPENPITDFIISENQIPYLTSSLAKVIPEGSFCSQKTTLIDRDKFMVFSAKLMEI